MKDIFDTDITHDYYSDYDMKVAPENLSRFLGLHLSKKGEDDPYGIFEDIFTIFPTEDFKYNYNLAKALEHLKLAIRDEIVTEKEIADYLQLTHTEVEEL